MYVCLCNALTTSDVRKVKRSGVCEPIQVYKILGCSMQCGKCLETIDEILQEKESQSSQKDIDYQKRFSVQVQA